MPANIRSKSSALGISLVLFLGAAPKSVAGPSAEGGIWPEAQLSNLTVCWEQPGNLDEKLWVAGAIEREYNGRTKAHFEGWEDCAATPNALIRVGAFDMQSHTLGLASEIAGRRYGIVLNFTFDNWNRPCQTNREACIQALAVHEFGHAVGLPDTLIPFNGDPQTCVGKSINHLSTALLTLDQDSVMNYCNTDWLAGTLDADDEAAIAKLYPSP